MFGLLSVPSIDFASLWSDIVAVMSGFTVNDAVEILILSVLLFFAFKFLKGKKAGALLVGIFVCIAFIGISALFELDVLYSIFNGIASYGIIVILIIFQPEIRDALERIGSGSIHGLLSFTDRKKKKELYQTVIENICIAVKEMSAESVGALIVIERASSLVDIINSGIEINADVKSSLIRNLFFNRAPLHDGAIVVSEGKISAAGCFLPLTRRSDVDPDLGTRHRAAIGLSEISDALTIVCSEETGAISVSFDGVLKRNISVEELRDTLFELFVKTSWN